MTDLEKYIQHLRLKKLQYEKLSYSPRDKQVYKFDIDKLDDEIYRARVFQEKLKKNGGEFI